MGVAVVGAAVITGGAMAYSASKSSKASKSAVNAANEEVAWQKERFEYAKDFLADQAETGREYFDQGIKYGESSLAMAEGQNQAFQQQSEMYGMKAEENEAKMGAYFDEFLGGFEEMLADNEGALADFNRRYGNIMDNVQQGIMDVSAESLSAQGREQLSLDSATLSKAFNNSMATRNMGRSGMSVEGEMRMANETAAQARAIDVNANQQAIQLQGQGIQNLNSMYGQQTNLQNQRQQILQNQGLGQQGIGNTYGSMATGMYGASQNMFGQGFTNTLNANNNLANMFSGQGQNMMNTESAFYAGTQTPSNANLINAYGNQSSQYGADAAGYAKLGGTILGNTDWSNFGAQTGLTTPAGETTS